MAANNPGWRAAVAMLLAVAAGSSGPVLVDRYNLVPENYLFPVVFAAAGLLAARDAMRSRLRGDRRVGIAVFVVLSLFLLYILYDRITTGMGWRPI